MKKFISAITLSLLLTASSVFGQSASVLTPTATSITVSTTLSSGIAQSLMAGAMVPRGTIRVSGQFAIISGFATIQIPLSQLSLIVTNIPAGYDMTNITSGTTMMTSNGVVVSAVLTQKL